MLCSFAGLPHQKMLAGACLLHHSSTHGTRASTQQRPGWQTWQMTRSGLVMERARRARERTTDAVQHARGHWQWLAGAGTAHSVEMGTLRLSRSRSHGAHSARDDRPADRPWQRASPSV